SRVTAAPRRRTKGVVIKDPKESSIITSIIIHTESKSKDKGKGILVEEPKPLIKQAQIKQDEKYARELEAELKRNIDWDKVIDHVKIKAKEDPAVKRYQALKRKPQTEAQARKNMMIYLKNVDGFKMDYFKGMTYDDMCPIFEAKFDSNLDDEVEELKRHLQIVPNEDDDVYTEAILLARKVLVVDSEVQEVVDVVTTAKIITKVVIAASETITAASTTITAAEAHVHAATLTAAPSRVTAAPRRRTKGVVIKDPKESSIIT
nr:hypothetical protein [Tanacetum cinerariifolium]